jgi:hypothetical protein
VTQSLSRQEVRLASPMPDSGMNLPDAASTAAQILTQALAFCAQQMGLDSPEIVAGRLRQNDGVASKYCLYSVSKQVAGTLGSLDEHVQAVYTLDYDATPADLCFAVPAETLPLIHLIVWTRRKTAAFDALVAVLDRALVRILADKYLCHPLEHTLDVQTIDDNDVKSGTTYGALLTSIHHRPIQIWKR